MESRATITISPGGAVRRLAVVGAILLAAHVTGLVVEYGFGYDYALGLVPLFDVDQEHNLPTLFSTFLWLASALLFFCVGRASRQCGRPYRIWWFLAGIGVFFAADEFSSIHEKVADPLREALGLSGAFHHAWIIPYGIVAGIVAAMFLPVFLRLGRRTQIWLVAAGATFVGGAIGFEMIAGHHLESLAERRDLTYEIAATLEESMEMAGLIMLVYALASLLRNDLGGATIRVPAAGEVAAAGESPARPAPRPSPAASSPEAARSAAREPEKREQRTA